MLHTAWCFDVDGCVCLGMRVYIVVTLYMTLIGVHGMHDRNHSHVTNLFGLIPLPFHHLPTLGIIPWQLNFGC